MRLLHLSAYAAHSHASWQRRLQAMFPRWEWCVLTLPPRHFNWRMRGNALYWSVAERGVLEQEYDLLLVTSTVDLATLRGLVPALAGLPTLVYFHENQFAYPSGAAQQGLLEIQVTSLYTALAADSVVFNSAYNRDTFLSGCAALLDRLPDYVPAGVVDSLRQRSRVLPVPVDCGDVAGTAPTWPRESRAGQLRLVWTGRLEYDRGGEGLLALVEELEGRQVPYELAVVGQRFRRCPQVFEQVRARLGQRLVHLGYLPERRDYLSLLAAADLVVSTSLHEFQGLAVMEAVLSGCLPVLPDRLAYPEFFPARFRYLSSPQDPRREANAAATLVLELADARQRGQVSPPDLDALRPDSLRSGYARLFAELADGRDGLRGPIPV